MVYPKKGTPEYKEWILTPEYTEYCNKRSAATKGEKNPMWKQKRPDLVELNKSEKHRKETSKRMSERYISNETREKISKSRIGVSPPNKGKHLSIETRMKISKSNTGRKNPILSELNKKYEIRIKQVETKVGGFCYSNVQNDPPKPRVYYCEAWNDDLFKRIDIAQKFKSILSGKTKENNLDKHGKPRNLTHHHVYWQPKACCGFDADIDGYYAWINIGTTKYPNWYKHYIDGDPNKFVLLTAEEHGMVSKDKIKWIEIFEKLIETELNGKCYLPKKK